MPTKQKITAKPPLDPHLKKITLSIPTALVAEVDAIAKETGLARADTIEKILTACTFQGSDPAAPHACPRGYRPPAPTTGRMSPAPALCSASATSHVGAALCARPATSNAMSLKSKTCTGNKTGKPLTEYGTESEARDAALYASA